MVATIIFFFLSLYSLVLLLLKDLLSALSVYASVMAYPSVTLGDIKVLSELVISHDILFFYSQNKVYRMTGNTMLITEIALLD